MVDIFVLQTFKFSASDLEDLGVLGTGNYGTVSKMRYTPTKQLMAMKVKEGLWDKSIYEFCDDEIL